MVLTSQKSCVVWDSHRLQASDWKKPSLSQISQSPDLSGLLEEQIWHLSICFEIPSALSEVVFYKRHKWSFIKDTRKKKYAIITVNSLNSSEICFEFSSQRAVQRRKIVSFKSERHFVKHIQNILFRSQTRSARKRSFRHWRLFWPIK